LGIGPHSSFLLTHSVCWNAEKI